jgi:hypothetical protein
MQCMVYDRVYPNPLEKIIVAIFIVLQTTTGGVLLKIDFPANRCAARLLSQYRNGRIGVILLILILFLLRRKVDEKSLGCSFFKLAGLERIRLVVLARRLVFSSLGGDRNFGNRRVHKVSGIVVVQCDSPRARKQKKVILVLVTEFTLVGVLVNPTNLFVTYQAFTRPCQRLEGISKVASGVMGVSMLRRRRFSVGTCLM